MGTAVSIDVRGARAPRAPVARVLTWLHHVDATYSTYRPESVICRLARGELAHSAAPAPVRAVLERCRNLRAETGGFFDARTADGGLDPSALIKGWAVQRSAALLRAAGLRDFCINAGGDVLAAGVPRPEPTWRVGVQHPRDRTAVAAIVAARDLAVATSGAYERGTHIRDPRSGQPPEGVLSVTVTGPDLGTADAYSTAAFAMGLEGPAWTLRLPAGYEAMTILDDDTVLCTPGFPSLERAR
jgi:thiamine biosynthesis lipoprotein